MASSAIKKGAVISYVSIAANMLLTFFYTPWMIKEIGMSDYGLYSLISAFISYFLLDFGLSGSVQRFVAKYRAEDNVEKESNLIGLISKIYIGIDAVIFICLLIAYFFLTDIFTGLTPVELEKLKILYVIAGIFSVLTFALKPFDGILMAHEYFVEAKILDMINRFGTVFLIITILLLGGDVYALVLVNGAAAFGVSLTKYFIFKRKSHLNINWKYHDRQELRNLFMFSFWVFLIGLAQQLRLNLMPTILGVTSDTTEISVFSVGRMIEGIVFTITFALNGLFLPKVTRLLHNDNMEDVSKLMIRVGRIQLFIITCIFTGFIIFGKSFINLWVGDDFSDVYIILILLIATNIVSLTETIASDIMYVKNKVLYNALAAIISSLVGFVIAFVLSYKYGAIGCAFGVFFALVTNLIAVNWFYCKKLNIPLKKFFMNCHAKILPVLIIVAIISFFIRQQFLLENWLSLMIGIVIYSMVYFLISYFILFNQEEKQIVRSVLHLGR